MNRLGKRSFVRNLFLRHFIIFVACSKRMAVGVKQEFANAINNR